jgi:hypothetical protein
MQCLPRWMVSACPRPRPPCRMPQADGGRVNSGRFVLFLDVLIPVAGAYRAGFGPKCSRIGASLREDEGTVLIGAAANMAKACRPPGAVASRCCAQSIVAAAMPRATNGCHKCWSTVCLTITTGWTSLPCCSINRPP